MTGIDRERLLELLGQLGAESDAVALSAAREASRMVANAGTTWTALLGTESQIEEEPAQPQPAAAGSEKSDEARLVERLLSRKDISDTLRKDLEDFRKQIAAGELDRMDADYIRALARRLGQG